MIRPVTPPCLLSLLGLLPLLASACALPAPDSYRGKLAVDDFNGLMAAFGRPNLADFAELPEGARVVTVTLRGVQYEYHVPLFEKLRKTDWTVNVDVVCTHDLASDEAGCGFTVKGICTGGLDTDGLPPDLETEGCDDSESEPEQQEWSDLNETFPVEVSDSIAHASLVRATGGNEEAAISVMFSQDGLAFWHWVPRVKLPAVDAIGESSGHFLTWDGAGASNSAELVVPDGSSLEVNEVDRFLAAGELVITVDDETESVDTADSGTRMGDVLPSDGDDDGDEDGDDGDGSQVDEADGVTAPSDEDIQASLSIEEAFS